MQKTINMKIRGLRIVIFLIIVFCVGCMTQRAIVGIEIDPTDLSGLHISMPRYDAEDIVGDPTEVIIIDDSIYASYSINLGYVEAGKGVVAAPVGAFVDLMSLGAIGAISKNDIMDCQQGMLDIIYDSDGKIKSAWLVNSAINTSGFRPKNRDSCMYIMAHTEPSTLNRELTKQFIIYSLSNKQIKIDDLKHWQGFPRQAQGFENLYTFDYMKNPHGSETIVIERIQETMSALGYQSYEIVDRYTVPFSPDDSGHRYRVKYSYDR